MLKHSRSARGYEEKCYDWSSILLTPRTKLRHLVDIQDPLCELGGTGQSRSLCMTPTSYQYGKDGDIDVSGDLVDVQDVPSLLSGFSGRTESSEDQSVDNLHALDSDEHQGVADSEDDFFTSRIAVDFCWVIGIIISLLCLVKAYSWACKEQKRKSRPVICVPMHTLEARTKASSMCCWKGRRQSFAVARFRKAFRKWRWESVSVRHQRSNMILGAIFLFVLMFQPVAEGSGVVAQTAASSISTRDHQPSLAALVSADHAERGSVAPSAHASAPTPLGDVVGRRRGLQATAADERAVLEGVAAGGAGWPETWSAATAQGPCDAGWNDMNAGWNGVQCDAEGGSINSMCVRRSAHPACCGANVSDGCQCACRFLPSTPASGDISGFVALTQLQTLCATLAYRTLLATPCIRVLPFGPAHRAFALLLFLRPHGCGERVGGL
eukprot:SAG31_NODE_5700_length_2373_cov_3.526385_3_plen_439_part_00